MIYEMEIQLSKIPDLLRQAKQLGFSDRHMATWLNSTELAIDTMAADFPATCNAAESDVSFEERGVMVLGSGVYRIGSFVEFDRCAVRAIRTVREQGIPTGMVIYDLETVSTDYDEADRLYFENISLETILDIYDAERSRGVILSNVKIYGTSPEMIDTAENRFKFSRLLDEIGVDLPFGKELSNFSEARSFCNKVGYPVHVRPSHALSGAAMSVVSSADDLESYLTQGAALSREHSVVSTKYIEQAEETEMDAVAKDGKMIVHYISEHVENAGVHFGDVTLIHPPQDSNPYIVRQTNIDAIEMATKAMLDMPFEPYPDCGLLPDYIGVKVPQFSFSRLSGADFLYLEALGNDNRDKGKSEYTLTQHLANNLIDMYINLPSKHYYCRPASYTSKGHTSRRMAVDFPISFTTNVKNAKMRVEALARNLPPDVSGVHAKNSHKTRTLPGLRHVLTSIPQIGALDGENFRDATAASVSGGFSIALGLPLGKEDNC
ncbi:glutathione synthetase ATP-binding domain-like protein [Cylindrobasidium torrendii FP15055 ss-10]|uniref:Glutathione synthetase ATP-binding domain-like protein n=1 Tax=Cylindrobasidium torrendii FP15055 ss-10 TaxID=1314674 RepID=A0A0D7ARP9_9AGAR|nr:glutathione synthetase ATP-binding domain-like protein [Cylindrobasidium torrendii FP15055 ss-10]